MAKQGSFFKTTISVLIVLIIVAYTIFNTRLIIRGPEIELYDVYDGQIIEEDLIEIKGKAENISYISLNGRQIYIDENLEFKETLLLTNNINNIEIYARDRFGKETTKKIKLIGKNLDEFDEKEMISKIEDINNEEDVEEKDENGETTSD